MQRLIDATPVETFLDNKVRSCTGRDMSVLGYTNALARLYNEPTVDAVAVLRCEDCEHWGPRLPEDEQKAICWAFGAQPAAVTPAEGYCYRAERRKDHGDE